MTVIPAQDSIKVEVKNTVLNRIMLRTWDVVNPDHVILSDIRLNASEARALAIALCEAAEERNVIDATEAERQRQTIIRDVVAMDQPPRSAPMVDIIDYFTERMARLHPTWTVEARERARRATGHRVRTMNANDAIKLATILDRVAELATAIDVPLECEVGQKFIRIVNPVHGRSVHAFVDIATGDLLKAAGWKAPAKGARATC